MILKNVVNFTGLKNKKNKISFNLVLAFLFIFLTFALVIDPSKYIAVSLNGLLVWATVILPAILPFLLFSKFLTKLGVVDFFSKIISPLTKFLFKTDGTSAYVFTLSILSGYPVGAKITSDLFEDGRISKKQAMKIMTFSACSGPMFVLGTVGIGLFLSAKAGYIMLSAHILGAVLNGILYRGLFNEPPSKTEKTPPKVSDDDFLYQTAIQSANSMLVVGVYIVLFFVIIEFFMATLNLSPSVFSAILSGFFEITRSCQELAILNISLSLKTILASIIISFGGISTTVQSLAFLKKMEFKTPFFLLLKLTHAIFAGILTYLLILVFPL